MMKIWVFYEFDEFFISLFMNFFIVLIKMDNNVDIIYNIHDYIAKRKR